MLLKYFDGIRRSEDMDVFRLGIGAPLAWAPRSCSAVHREVARGIWTGAMSGLSARHRPDAESEERP